MGEQLGWYSGKDGGGDGVHPSKVCRTFGMGDRNANPHLANVVRQMGDSCLACYSRGVVKRLDYYRRHFYSILDMGNRDADTELATAV